jgi:hypothetical protein
MAGRIYEEEPGRPISGYAAQAVVELRRTANFANDHPRPRLGLEHKYTVALLDHKPETVLMEKQESRCDD